MNLSHGNLIPESENEKKRKEKKKIKTLFQFRVRKYIQNFIFPALIIVLCYLGPLN